MFSIYLVFFVGLLIGIAFCAGMILPILGESVLSLDSQNMFVRILALLKAKAGYLASFGAGILLMGMFNYAANPYTVARWGGIYEDAIVGSLITSDETILKTGQIPQDILDWYQNERGTQ